MTVSEIFETMEYGPAPESAAEAMTWLDTHDHTFGHFINGVFTQPGATFATCNPATGDRLAQITQARPQDIDAAVAAARAAQERWAALPAHQRARLLYALARLLQKHARLFAVLETLDNGKPVRESRDIDIPLAQRHFYYHAGMAQLMPAELPDREAIGVCAQIIPWNFPLLMLAWKIAPALAMGNTVVLKPAEYTSLTALLFAQICQEAGLPEGVVNIVTGDGRVGEMLVAAQVDKIAFTGSTQVGRAIRVATAGSGKALSLELGGKSPFIVFEDADQESAVEGIVDAIWFNQGQVCCAGSRLLVHESIATGFYAKLRRRMDTLRVGDPMDKTVDMGAVVDPVQHATITRMVTANTAGETYVAQGVLPATGCFYPPTLINGLSSADPLMQEEIFGPVLVATTFRTPDEATAIANDTRYGLAATIWSENINTALDIAPRLAAGVVWINATNLFDAAAGFGGVRESGFGREGGWEGLQAYTKPRSRPAAAPRAIPCSAPNVAHPAGGLDRTAKLYIGGKQTRPDSGYSTPVWSPTGGLLGHVGAGNRKDIRNAVDAAEKAKGWSTTTAHLRAQILYFLAENLSVRADEFVRRLGDMGVPAPEREVDASISRLFTYGAWADKNDGAAKPVPMRAVALALNEPVGIIAALCSSEAPLLGLISAMAPAIAMGNRVVLVPSAAFPLVATDFYQVLDTSDVPAGVVNIVTGDPQELGDTLAKHMAVGSLWSFDDPALAAGLEKSSALNLKRTWISRPDWYQTGEGRRYLAAATQTKTIWIPYGA
ncbi:MAG: aldehyde dehydrogenase (NAD+) [Paracoccaceae bacterium]|jgi:aldehyde dehydrogenase (NAD+)